MKSFRNIPRVNVLEVGAAGVVDVIGAASLVVSEGALEVLEERVGGEVDRTPKAASATEGQEA